MDEVEELRERVRVLEAENARLRHSEVGNKEKLADVVDSSMNHDSSSPSFQGDLKAEHIERYSRQLLINGGFGVEGQLKLLNSSVLVIGAGGIGSTLILYLAACGIGNLSVVDFDNVDVSNLHRQVIHKTNDVGMNKAESARRAVENLNPSISCKIVKEPLTANNALELISSHDCIVDASDNPQTRYIINDACVLSGKPLVSGSAMGIEGQLTVYNYNGGPCYRCLYPKPNVKEGNKSCSDNGVLGPVPGLIGILQAVETIKIITGTE
jgi:adenylyltransferase/sulfurtransferase